MAAAASEGRLLRRWLAFRPRREQRLEQTGSDPDPRFTFANERTFLAWNRTALALMSEVGTETAEHRERAFTRHPSRIRVRRARGMLLASRPP